MWIFLNWRSSFMVTCSSSRKHDNDGYPWSMWVYVTLIDCSCQFYLCYVDTLSVRVDLKCVCAMTLCITSSSYCGTFFISFLLFWLVNMLLRVTHKQRPSTNCFLFFLSVIRRDGRDPGPKYFVEFSRKIEVFICWYYAGWWYLVRRIARTLIRASATPAP